MKGKTYIIFMIIGFAIAVLGAFLRSFALIFIGINLAGAMAQFYVNYTRNPYNFKQKVRK